MSQEEIRNVIVYEILIPSLRTLYAEDYDNIRFGASERNICARLAHHMENTMRTYDSRHNEPIFEGYYADVEYNRMGNGDLKHYEDSEHRPRYMVSDLLIQKRGYGRNLLAVEMKRKGNSRKVWEDKNRLRSLVSSPREGYMEQRCIHDTLLGVFITYSANGVQLELFENKRGVGVNTGDIVLLYERHDDGQGELVMKLFLEHLNKDSVKVSNDNSII